MLAEVGLPPTLKSLNIVLVAKMFPTRNHEGNLGQEMPVKDADILGICEFGGGSWGIPDRRRRVGYFDFEILRTAAFVNGANQIALTGVDYYDHSLQYRTKQIDVTTVVKDLVDKVQEQVGAKVRYLSTGPDTAAMIDLKIREGLQKRKGPPDELDVFRGLN
jgi:adenylosuccinate synthase